MNNKIVYIDMDGVLCDFMTPFNENRHNLEYPQSEIGFFKNLKPIEGAIYAVNKLKQYYNVYILTRPSIHNLHCYTEKAEWIKTYLGFDMLEKTIISPDKSLLIGDYLIDDTDNANQKEFCGKWLHFNSDSFKDWQSILDYLIYENNVYIGEQIINFISEKYNIESYYTEYYKSFNQLKIVFNYNFYVLYDLLNKTLLLIDYDEKETNLTYKFNNYLEQLVIKLTKLKQNKKLTSFIKEK